MSYQEAGFLVSYIGASEEKSFSEYNITMKESVKMRSSHEASSVSLYNGSSKKATDDLLRH